MIYLDYAATCPIDKEVLDLYNEISLSNYANITSVHLLGQAANKKYLEYSNDITKALGMNNHTVIFTSGATEANNLAVLGVVEGKKGRIITTCIEHSSVSEIYKRLEKEYDVVYLPVLENGQVDMDALESSINKDTLIVSIMWVNNIVGTIQNIKRALEIVRKYPRCKLHIDAVQGVTKVKPDFDINDIDLLTFSSHKFYGPKGVGCLIKKNNLNLSKVLNGSTAQFNLRPGTFDLGLVGCSAKALTKYTSLRDENLAKVKVLFNRLYDAFKDNRNVVINSPKENACYYIFNFSVYTDHFVPSETIIHYLESKDICVSAGSSCSSKLAKPQATVYAMTKDEKRALGAVRVSFSHHTSIDEIDKLISAIKEYGDKYV